MAEGGEGGQEKSFEPTPKRLEDARRKGDVAKSTDVSAAAAYLGLLVALAAFGGAAAEATGAGLAAFLGRADLLSGPALGPGGGALVLGLAAIALLGLAPLFLLPFAGALLALLAQRAIVAAPEKLLPKLDRISPVATAAQKFGVTGLVEFAKGLVKLVAVSAVLWLVLMAELDSILGLLAAPPRQLPAELLRLLTGLLAAITALAIAIGAIDLLWQRVAHARKLRMSHEELREESRESEGDPHIKGQRRRRAEEIAKNRMLADVPKADVVIVNPTHYAVALAWSRKPGSAPHCVAKGVDAMAAAIRARAVEAGVPVREDPATARALHALVEIGAEVPPDLYRAVAAAIRFAETMRARARAGWRGRP